MGAGLSSRAKALCVFFARFRGFSRMRSGDSYRHILIMNPRNREKNACIIDPAPIDRGGGLN